MRTTYPRWRSFDTLDATRQLALGLARHGALGDRVYALMPGLSVAGHEDLSGKISPFKLFLTISSKEDLMKLNKSSILALFIALTVSSLSLSAVAAEKSLYDRLGGKPALEAVVGELWAITAKDARINKYFAKTKPEVFASQLVDFLCQASGGPCKYAGKNMYDAHTGMKLSEADFNALAENIVKALDKFKVPATEKGEVMNMLGGLKQATINH